MGDADRPVAGDQELGVTGAVAVESGPLVVEFPAIELDDQFRLGPQGVDLVAEDEDVGGRWRYPALDTEVVEALLQRRALGASVRSRFASSRRTGRSARRPLPCAQTRSTSPNRNSFSRSASSQACFSREKSTDFREIEERAGDRGDRDPRPSAGPQGASCSDGGGCPSPPQPSLAPAARVDIDQAPVATEAPEAGGALVAEHGVLAAGQHRRQPSPPAVDAAVPDRKRLAVERVEPAAAHHRLDRPLSKPHPKQLPAPHHPMLRTRQLPQPPVPLLPFLSFRSISTPKLRHAGVRPRARAPDPAPAGRF